jgi:hypothetical protein
MAMIAGLATTGEFAGSRVGRSKPRIELVASYNGRRKFHFESYSDLFAFFGTLSRVLDPR